MSIIGVNQAATADAGQPMCSRLPGGSVDALSNPISRVISAGLAGTLGLCAVASATKAVDYSKRSYSFLSHGKYLNGAREMVKGLAWFGASGTTALLGYRMFLVPKIAFEQCPPKPDPAFDNVTAAPAAQDVNAPVDSVVVPVQKPVVQCIPDNVSDVAMPAAPVKPVSAPEVPFKPVAPASTETALLPDGVCDHARAFGRGLLKFPL